MQTAFSHFHRISFLFITVTLYLLGYWWESQQEGDHWEDQEVDGWTILKWILER
jgi:hypothetical protein